MKVTFYIMYNMLFLCQVEQQFSLTPYSDKCRVVLEVLAMIFLSNPNLPENPVRLAVVDSRISGASRQSLEASDVTTLRMMPHPALYDAVKCHPDMLLNHIGTDLIVYAPGTDDTLLDGLRAYGFRLIRGGRSITGTYPGDIAYNAARAGRYYFHNLKHTDAVLAELLEKQGIEPVHVEQGYAKCSVLPVDESSIITADAGIARAAEKKGFDVLLLENERSIKLPGLDYGFIGGACCMMSKTVCAVNGSLDKLDGKAEITSFLSKRNISIVNLSDESVTDIGSILPLMMSERSN